MTPGQMEEALGELVREYQRTGRAGVLRQSTVMVVPFGHSQPVLACAPLRASVVELQPGEVVLGVVAGDTERFAVEQTHTGPAGRTPLVVVKPLAYDVTTNLVVSTDRRVYHVTLDSAPRPSRAGQGRGRRGQPPAPLRPAHPVLLPRRRDARRPARRRAPGPRPEPGGRPRRRCARLARRSPLRLPGHGRPRPGGRGRARVRRRRPRLRQAQPPRRFAAGRSRSSTPSGRAATARCSTTPTAAATT